jgi:hypothetical protein
MKQHYKYKLGQQWMAGFLFLGLFLQSCSTNNSPISEEKTPVSHTTDNQKPVVPQTISLDLINSHPSNLTNTLSIANVEDGQEIPQIHKLTSHTSPLDNRLSIHSSTVINKKSIENTGLKSRSNTKPDKGKERIKDTEEKVSEQPEIQFQLGKQAYNTWKNKKADLAYLHAAREWLGKAAAQDYELAIDLLEKVEQELIQFTAQQEKGSTKHTSSSTSSAINQNVNKEVKLAPPSSIAYQAKLVSKGTTSLENLKNYYKTLFSRITSLEAYNKFRTNLYKIIDNNYNEYHEDCFPSIWDNLLPYIESILHANYFDSLPQEDQLKLVNSFYALNFKIASCNLGKMFNSVRTGKYNLIDLQRRGKNYQEAKKRLQISFGVPKKLLPKNYLQLLNEIYESTIGIIPDLDKYCNPQTIQKKTYLHTPHISQRRLKMVQKKQSAYALKVTNTIKENLLTNDPSASKFPIIFSEFVVLLKNEDASCLQHIGEELEKWNRYATRFLELEQLAFADSFSEPGSTCTTSELTLDNLVKLYESLHKSFPNYNMEIYQFMKGGIIILIRASKFEQTLLRLKAADIFYTSEICPQDFEGFHALAYALCGRYDRLTALNNSIIQQQLAKKRKLQEKQAQQHRKKIAEIQEAQKLQPSLAPSPPLDL